MKEIKQPMKRKNTYIDSTEEKYCTVFERFNIRFDELSGNEMKQYQKEWVRHHTPSEKLRGKVEKLCLPQNEFSPFLWHVFSYRILPSIEGDEARKAYLLAEKRNCVLFDNIDFCAYRLENADALTPEVLDMFTDVTITAEDFSWTYSKTHEKYCGPYFYKR